MTNGEKLKEVFPCETKEKFFHNGENVFYEGLDFLQSFRTSWWNAEYKEPTNNRVEALPYTTPPIRSKGHWIWEVDETPSTPISPHELNYAGWVCSCCHEFPDNICEWDNPDEPPTYKFCHNCGAKMNGVE